MNYFLWRDRKGILTNFFSFFANLILFQIILLSLYEVFWPDAYQFLSVFQESEVLFFLLWFNAFLLVNRVAQRILLVTQYYGIFQGFLSLPRMILGNFINFLANWRAIKQVLKNGNPRRVAWDKTTHDFPFIGEVSRARRLIGQILIEQGFFSEQDLRQALSKKPEGMRLGTWLVHSERLTPEQLASGLAEQAEVGFESIDTYEISDEIVRMLSSSMALHYAVFPIRLEGETLVVASESTLSPIVLSALRRKLGREVRYVIALIGQVTVGLRYRYVRVRVADPRKKLDQAVRSNQILAEDESLVWRYYVTRQIMLGEVLQSLGRIDASALSAMLLQHSESDLPLGTFLVKIGIITEETLQFAIALQEEIQPKIESVIALFSAPIAIGDRVDAA